MAKPARPPLIDVLVPGYVFVSKTYRRYELIKTLGMGGMGAVYEARELEPKTSTKSMYGGATTVAIKVERNPPSEGLLQRKGLRIAMEKLVMKSCAKSPHFPRFVDSGRTNRFGWIAMELVGKSLYELRFKSPNGRLSAVTVLKILIQALKALQDMHGAGFVHRDFKPDNLTTGLGHRQNRIYIIDTGLARQYKSVDGVAFKPRSTVPFFGSQDFASVARHRSMEIGPKDDVETLFYTASYLLFGKLPWVDAKNTMEILLKKHECRLNPDRLFEGSDLCPVLSELYKYVVELRGYADPVDYTYMINSLTAMLERMGGAGTLFDWEIWEKQR